MEYTNIISESRAYVSTLLSTQLDPKVTFHTIDHTQNVVNAVSKMSEFYKLNPLESTILITSAWFHDTGHIKQCKGHEEISKNILRDFFRNKKVSQLFIEKCCQCIDATQMGSEPKSHLDAIINDADFFHITMPNYWIITEQLKQEIEYLNKTHINNKDWYEGNLQFLDSLQFSTNYYNQEFHGIKDQRILENKMILKDFDFSYLAYENNASTLQQPLKL